MIKTLGLTVWIICGVLFLCNAHVGFGQEPGEDVLFSQKKTACYGYCPTYELTVFHDGRVVFFGEAHVEPLGRYAARLNELELIYFKQEFEKIRFFELEDQYYQEVSDRSTTYVYYNDGTREKKIMDYYGAPAGLKGLEKKIEALIGKLEWEVVE